MALVFAAAGAYFLDQRMPRFEKEAPPLEVLPSGSMSGAVFAFVSTAAARFVRTSPHLSLLNTLPFNTAWGLTRLQRVLGFATANFVVFGLNALFVSDSVATVCVNSGKAATDDSGCDTSTAAFFVAVGIGSAQGPILTMLGLLFSNSVSREQAKEGTKDDEPEALAVIMQDTGLQEKEKTALQAAVVSLFHAYDTRRDGALDACEMSAVREDFVTDQLPLTMVKQSMKDKLLVVVAENTNPLKQLNDADTQTLTRCAQVAAAAAVFILMPGGWPAVDASWAPFKATVACSVLVFLWGAALLGVEKVPPLRRFLLRKMEERGWSSAQFLNAVFLGDCFFCVFVFITACASWHGLRRGSVPRTIALFNITGTPVAIIDVCSQAAFAIDGCFAVPGYAMASVAAEFALLLLCCVSMKQTRANQGLECAVGSLTVHSDGTTILQALKKVVVWHWQSFIADVTEELENIEHRHEVTGFLKTVNGDKGDFVELADFATFVLNAQLTEVSSPQDRLTYVENCANSRTSPQLPYWGVYVGTALCLTLIGVFLWIVIIFGYKGTEDDVAEWTSSVVVSITTSMCPSLVLTAYYAYLRAFPDASARIDAHMYRKLGGVNDTELVRMDGGGDVVSEATNYHEMKD